MNLVRVINHEQQRVTGRRAMDEKFLRNSLQLFKLAFDVAETNLLQKQTVKLQGISAGFVDRNEVGFLVEAAQEVI